MIKRELLAVLASLALACTPVVAQQKKEIKLSHSAQASPDAELHAAAELFEKEVEARAPTLDVKLYPNNALGQERDVYEAMQLGAGAACAISGTAILTNFNKRLGVLDLPFLWKDYEHVHKVLDGQVGDTLAKEMEKSGFKVIAWMDSWGYRNVVTANKEVKDIGDLKGLKIRTIQTPIYVTALNAMGANATPMAFGEVYSAMQTGVLDGFEHSAAMIVANKLYEVGHNVALTKHLFGPIALVCSMKEWSKLNSDEQRIMLEAAKIAQAANRREAPAREEAAFKVMRDKGMKLSNIDTSPIRPAIEKVQNDLAKERGATDLLESIRSAGRTTRHYRGARNCSDTCISGSFFSRSRSATGGGVISA